MDARDAVLLTLKFSQRKDVLSFLSASNLSVSLCFFNEIGDLLSAFGEIEPMMLI